MNLRFEDLMKLIELQNAKLLINKGKSLIDFVIYSTNIENEISLEVNNLLILNLDEFIFNADTVAKLNNLQCAGVVIFSKNIFNEINYRELGLKTDLILANDGTKAKQLMQKVLLITSLSQKDENLNSALVDSLLHEKEIYSLLDWVYLMSVMEVDVFCPYQVAIIKVGIEARQKDIYANLKDVLRTNFGLKLFSIWDNVLLVILPEKMGERFAIDTMREVYAKHLNEADKKITKIALGDAAKGLENIQKSFREALRTLDMIQIMQLDDNICEYKMLGIYCVLYDLYNPESFAKYCNDTFGKLWIYDEENQANLFETLDVYFANECDADATSKALFIHKNTLRYRIKKIEEILEVNLQNINVITEIVTAFKIRRLTSIL